MRRGSTKYHNTMRGPTRVRIIGSQLVKGLVYYTALEPRTMETWPWCLLLSPLGGGAASYVHAPLAIPPEGAGRLEQCPEALLLFDSRGGCFLAGVACIPAPETLRRETEQGDVNEPRGPTFTPQDCVIRNGEGALGIEASGQVTLASAGLMRLQASAGGVSVFVDGEGTPAPVVSLPPTLEVLNELVGRVNALSRALADVYDRMRGAGAGTAFINPFPTMFFADEQVPEVTESIGAPGLRAPPAEP